MKYPRSPHAQPKSTVVPHAAEQACSSALRKVHSTQALGPLLLGSLVAIALAACGHDRAPDARFPTRPPGCAVQLFRGKVAGIPYADIGHVDAICGNELGEAACLDELRNQACKLGGDLLYDVPDEPQRPSPDKVRLTGRVAHTRQPAATKSVP